jgi:hypothetical protein
MRRFGKAVTGMQKSRPSGAAPSTASRNGLPGQLVEDTPRAHMATEQAALAVGPAIATPAAAGGFS